MKRKKFEHQFYSMSIPFTASPEDQEIIDLLEKKFIREWKIHLQVERSHLGKREFSKQFNAWLEKAR